MGMKKSVVAISACESFNFHTAASSAVSMPTISCGGRNPGALAFRMSDSTPGAILQPQPPPCEKLVRRSGAGVWRVMVGPVRSFRRAECTATGDASPPEPHSYRIAMNLLTVSSFARQRRAVVQSLAALSLGAAALLGSSAVQAQANVLRVSAIPDEAPSELQKKFKPLGEYLKAKTGLDVQFVPVTDYAAVVEGLAARKIDLAWLGGFTFVQAKLRSDGQVVPIVQRAEDAKFTSKFIVPVDSPIKTVADLKGHTFTFGAPSSTSGSLMPRYFLQQQGIVPERDFKTVAFSGAHDATVAFVASGRADAGALNTSVLDKLVEEKNPNALKVRVLATTPPFFDYNWTVRPGLDPALVKKLTDAFLALDASRPADKEILDLQRASKFIPTTAANYDGIEAAGKSAGLIK